MDAKPEGGAWARGREGAESTHPEQHARGQGVHVDSGPGAGRRGALPASGRGKDHQGAGEGWQSAADRAAEACPPAAEGQRQALALAGIGVGCSMC
eukprot:8603058-Lingulodinium_polyedra.AAC.2